VGGWEGRLGILRVKSRQKQKGMFRMRILLANPRGFCAGVNMAIDTVERVLELQGAPVYVFHEIVHNRHVVEDFKAKGVVFVDAIEDVPVGSTVIYSAHGVSPDVRRAAAARDLIQVDATCPLVAKVHVEAVRYARQKYTIVMIGHRDHDEVVGTVGEAPDSIHIVQAVEDVEALNIPEDHRIAYLTQTTLSLDDAAVMIAALRKKYPRIQSPAKEDICYATTNRQLAVKHFAPECDLVLVVGSANSSNSTRLVEIAANRGVAAHLVDDISEVDPDWFKGVTTVLVTAGASAPEWLVQELVQTLKARYGATVESRQLMSENLEFESPWSLRQLKLA
jgi:4-hydroxy-3-methylbut-2-enyl diphosphate reductase